MRERGFGPFRGRTGEAAGPDEHYECAYCQAVLDEWAEACPECDQLVIRVVDR